MRLFERIKSVWRQLQLTAFQIDGGIVYCQSFRVKHKYKF